jgi:hypothetical protein
MRRCEATMRPKPLEFIQTVQVSNSLSAHLARIFREFHFTFAEAVSGREASLFAAVFRRFLAEPS